jgi:hypothetical protein
MKRIEKYRKKGNSEVRKRKHAKIDKKREKVD